MNFDESKNRGTQKKIIIDTYRETISKRYDNFIYVTPRLLIFKTQLLSHFKLFDFTTETFKVLLFFGSPCDLSNNTTRAGICCQYLPKQRFRFSA